jgi:uncharacterized membrane protein HdeD (DUF308 family)
MNEKYDPSWIHLLDDVMGFIVILVALVSLLELTISFTYALEVFSIGLVAMGVAWLLWSVYVIHKNRYARVFMFLTGVILIAISLVEFLFVSLPTNLLIMYPAMAMFFVGVSRIALGIWVGDIPLWIQMLQVLSGILTINLAAFVFIFPGISYSTMLILLVLSLIANGLVRLIVGRTDVKKQLIEAKAASEQF